MHTSNASWKSESWVCHMSNKPYCLEMSMVVLWLSMLIAIVACCRTFLARNGCKVTSMRMMRHTTFETMEFTQTKLQGCITSCFEDQHWTPRSCDLTSLEYSLVTSIWTDLRWFGNWRTIERDNLKPGWCLVNFYCIFNVNNHACFLTIKNLSFSWDTLYKPNKWYKI